MFLATTALEEFWDFEHPLLFLGEWCCRYDRRTIWQPLQSTMIPNPWVKAQQRKDFYYYIKKMYEEVLLSISDAMNRMHNVDKGVTYWRIVMGPWLYWYITALYDRYVRLSYVIGQYSDVTTLGLAQASFVSPRDTLDSLQMLNDDPYNLQICTELLHSMGMDFPTREVTNIGRPDSAERTGLKKNDVRAVLGKMGRHIFRKMGKWGAHYHPILIRNIFFTGFQEIELMLRTGCKVWSIGGELDDPPVLPMDHQMRSHLRLPICRNDEFSCHLNKLLSEAVPQSFVERYGVLREKADNEFPSTPRIIFSSSRWYHDELFKVWAAECQEKKTKLVGLQHGGVYGSGIYLSDEDHELRILDRFYSWGWTRKNQKNIHPCSPPHLFRKRRHRNNEVVKDILLVTTTQYRYFNALNSLMGSMREYLLWQQRFMKSLSSEIQKKVTVRLHRQDFGWCFRQRLEDKYSDIEYESWETPFGQKLNHYRLFVFDHNSTTFLEALSANRPTVLFWNPKTTEFHTDAVEYYDALRSVGVLQDTPESAASKVTEVYDWVEEWWKEPTIQIVREKFCHRFARTSSNFMSEWVHEMKELANETAFPKRSTSGRT